MRKFDVILKNSFLELNFSKTVLYGIFLLRILSLKLVIICMQDIGVGVTTPKSIVLSGKIAVLEIGTI